MPIPVLCPACGQRHKAPDAAAGRTLKCLACGGPVAVPAPEIDPAAVLLEDDAPPPHLPEAIPVPAELPVEDESYALSEPPEPEPPPPPKRGPVRPPKPKPDVATLPPLTTDDPPIWRRHLHWLLVFAMIPLAASLLSKPDDEDLFEKIARTLDDAPADARVRFESRVGADDATLDDLIEALPRQRVKGAWLARGTHAHWGMALAATALFLVFFMFLASDGSARPTHVLAVGLFTATIGVGFLLLVQVIAASTDGRPTVGRGVFIVVFALLRFIAFSYAAALDPENGFWLSFFGFTFGVGLCEELVKTVPLFAFRDGPAGKTWRGLFVWGLASGAGFGIAEGILYAGDYYNGIAGPGIYVVRFVSCVALHATWSGSVAVMLYRMRDRIEQIEVWHDWIGPVMVVIAVPMVLHGLYDTCLKREMNGAALAVAAASFGWLAFQTGRLYGTDDAAATRAMLAEYKRRRRAMG